MNYSRRQFGKLAVSAFPAATFARRVPADSVGVRLGVCTYSFRDLPRDASGDAIGPVLKAMKDCGGTICELFSPQVEPDLKSGAELRQWRLQTPASYFHAVRQKFDAAGVEIYAYTLNFSANYTDAELAKCFEQTKALGVKIIASSTQLPMLARLQPLAEKHQIYVAVHGHSATKDPNEFSSPATFQEALQRSRWFKVNLDIGHFSAAGFDPVAFIEEHHDRITHLHIKDRKRNDGPNAPFGEGDTPIKPVIALLKKKKYPIPALIEYEYAGTGTPVAEVRKSLAYLQQAAQDS